MNLSLKGKNAFVCGSTQGIGLASAKKLAERGATITLIARNKELLASLVSSLNGGGHDYICADFNDPDFFSSSNSSSFSSGNSAFGSFDFTIPSSWRNKS